MKKLIQHLSNCITEERKALFEKNLKERTKYFTVVLENIYQPLNASAVLRSCDCFGIQDIHIIENYNEFKPDTEVAMGASNWLSINHYKHKKNNTIDCIKKLKKQGYRIVATSPHKTSQTLNDFNIHNGKAALFFGTETKGLSQIVMEEADEFIYIPMYGFTESFNLSVSAAICLNHLRTKLNNSTIDWRLNQKEKDIILLNWLRYSIDRCDIVEKDFFKNRLRS